MIIKNLTKFLEDTEQNRIVMVVTEDVCKGFYAAGGNRYFHDL